MLSKFLVAFLCCHFVFFFDFSVGVGAFVIGLSKIFLLLFIAELPIQHVFLHI